MADKREVNGVGRRSIIIATLYGLVCHVTFAVAVATMVAVLFTGMSAGLGRLAAPWSWLADMLLLIQFPILHTALLSPGGQAIMRRLVPAPLGAPMLTTTYALLASLQTLALFSAWTPIGGVIWRAQGWLLLAFTMSYGFAWLFLGKAILDAGASLQTGLLGWRSVVTGRPPAYPPMPTRGLFRWSRQPIYLGFALTTWTVPTLTPDGLVVALILTGYCLIGPLFKEARFRRRYGAAFADYQAAVPYWLPRPRFRLRGTDERTG
jgi:protein-S-isoprenylcysteine O-methyltransferase Ste14